MAVPTHCINTVEHFVHKLPCFCRPIDELVSLPLYIFLVEKGGYFSETLPACNPYIKGSRFEPIQIFIADGDEEAVVVVVKLSLGIETSKSLQEMKGQL